MRKIVAVISGVLVLVVVNWVIFAREGLLKNGQVVVLELAPIDPRSLMQGDYMALRFKVSDDAFGRRIVSNEVEDGRLVVKLNDHLVGSFVRIDKGEPLMQGEKALRFRIRNDRVKLATNAYFFQEGTAQDFDHARYGEFRVSPSGDLLLTYLLNEKFERLGQPGK